MLTLAQQQKLTYQKSILKYPEDSIEDDTSEDLLGEDLLGDDLLDDDSSAHINSNINLNTEVNSNSDEDMTGDNFLKENSGINIEDLFQQVQDKTICKRLTKDVLEQTYSFFQHPINKMSISDWVPICGLKCDLQPFSALRVYGIFAVEVTTMSGEILADDIGLRKVKYLLFYD